jgi:hypothetical protein
MGRDDVIPRKKKKVVPLKKPRRTPVHAVLPAAALAVVSADRIAAVTGEQALRFAAGILYEYSRLTVEELATRPGFFKTITLNTMRRWATEDNWIDRRQQKLDYFRDFVSDHIGTEIVQARRHELSVLSSLFQETVAQLQASRPSTYEGMLQALVKLAMLMDSWRDKITGQLTTHTPKTMEEAETGGEAGKGKGEVPTATPVALGNKLDTLSKKLTPDEARALGRELMRIRRQVVRVKKPPADDGEQ